MTTPFHRWLAKQNPKPQLEQQAKQEFPPTADCREAGFLLEDGTMLDFSGKQQGGSGQTRNYDHREICRAIDTGNNAVSGQECMEFFERHANALRFSMYGRPEDRDMYVSWNTFQHPTRQQVARILACCRIFEAKAFVYDVYGEQGHRLHEGVIEQKPCDQMVIDVVTTFLRVQHEECETARRSK